MQVTVWSDVICPWAYLGRDRSEVMEHELGCTIVRQSYELHPETPTTPRQIRPEGRYGAVLSQVAELCAEDGIPFQPPTATANSRDALIAIEVVRALDPAAVDRFEGVLFESHFVHDRIPASSEVIRDAMDAVGIPYDAITGSRRSAALAAISVARLQARDVGVSATPSWLFPSGFVMPGAQTREQTRRWVGRIVARSERASDTPTDR